MATLAEIYAELQVIFADIFGRDDLALHPDLTAKQVPGWDSFKQIEIVMAAEEHWSIKFRTRELDRLLNVGDLARMIAAKTSGA
jgi:acyl carrier protein